MAVAPLRSDRPDLLLARLNGRTCARITNRVTMADGLLCSGLHPRDSNDKSKAVKVKSSFLRDLENVNKELWVVLLLFLLAGLLNLVVASQRVVLGLYTLPTVMSAYLYGRRHATRTALASVLLVVLLAWFNPNVLASHETAIVWGRRMDVTIWGGTIMITGYLMGTLYDHTKQQVRELRETYNGVL